MALAETRPNHTHGRFSLDIDGFFEWPNIGKTKIQKAPEGAFLVFRPGRLLGVGGEAFQPPNQTDAGRGAEQCHGDLC